MIIDNNYVYFSNSEYDGENYHCALFLSSFASDADPIALLNNSDFLPKNNPIIIDAINTTKDFWEYYIRPKNKSISYNTIIINYNGYYNNHLNLKYKLNVDIFINGKNLITIAPGEQIILNYPYIENISFQYNGTSNNQFDSFLLFESIDIFFTTENIKSNRKQIRNVSFETQLGKENNNNNLIFQGEYIYNTSNINNFPYGISHFIYPNAFSIYPPGYKLDGYKSRIYAANDILCVPILIMDDNFINQNNNGDYFLYHRETKVINGLNININPTKTSIFQFIFKQD